MSRASVGVPEADIWRTRDRFGREVFLTSARRAHILNEHADLASRWDEVRTAVEHPDLVTLDAKYPHREIHCRRTPSEQGFIKVVVNYRPIPRQGPWGGEVITAYRVKRPKSKEEPREP